MYTVYTCIMYYLANQRNINLRTLEIKNDFYKSFNTFTHPYILLF